MLSTSYNCPSFEIITWEQMNGEKEEKDSR